jgi:predicted lysophospholipase L1 biosynthesis ABC-type transport system permease subunit
MRDRKGRLAERRGSRKGPKNEIPRKLTPFSYIMKDTWRNRSRTLMSISGICALSLLFVLFSSMDRGLEEYFEDEGAGVPSEERKELFKVKQVMDDWVYLITLLCWVLMVLVVANTSIITVVERKHELASLRALGISSFQVSSLVAASMAIIVLGGCAAGLVLGGLSVLLLDNTNLSILGGDIRLPLYFDPLLILYTVLLGAVSGFVGLVPPLTMISRSSPLEVLRDAG